MATSRRLSVATVVVGSRVGACNGVELGDVLLRACARCCSARGLFFLLTAMTYACNKKLLLLLLNFCPSDMRELDMVSYTIIS